MVKWTSASIFHLLKSPTIEEIAELPKWEPPGKGKYSIGIVPIFKEEYAVPVGNSGCWFRLRSSGPKISSSEKTFRINKRLADCREKEIDLTKDLINKIKDEETEKLKKQTPPTHVDIDVLYRDDWFIVCAGAATKCDLVTLFLNDKLETFHCKLPEFEEDLTGLGLNLFRSEDLMVDNCELGAAVKIKLTDGTVADISESQYPTGLLTLLKRAKEVMHMGVKWEKFGGNIRRDLSFTAIADGFDPTEVDGEYDDPDEKDFVESRARAERFIQNMPLFLKDISVHCGGFVKVEPENDAKT